MAGPKCPDCGGVLKSDPAKRTSTKQVKKFPPELKKKSYPGLK